MSRWTSSTLATEATSSTVTLAVLADLDFPTGHIRVHDGVGTLSHGGYDYSGVGQFGGIELDAEDEEAAAKGARLTLSGIPADLVPDVLTVTGYQRRDCTLYIGFLDAHTGAWVDTPEVLWSGQMDHMDLETGPDGARLILRVEDELRREPLQAWYTDEDQQLRYTGDRFFSDLPNVEIYRATWGSSVTGWSGVLNNALRRWYSAR